MKVIGLSPAAVRLDLLPCELPMLVDELLTRIEAHSASLREEHQQLERSLSDDRLQDASNWLLEYRNLLAAISDNEGAQGARVSVITPMAVAVELVPACAHDAAEHLDLLITSSGGDREHLQPAATALAAWVDTLADLRYVDEEAPEAIDL